MKLTTYSTYITLIEDVVYCKAFVSNKREGLIFETPCKLDESLYGITRLDIETERKIIEETFKKIKNNKSSTEQTITLAMKDLGLKRYVKLI